MGSQYSNAAFLVVEGNHGFFDALTWEDEFDPRTTKVSSVSSMVNACAKNTVSEGRAIDFLLILGHGTAGFQGVGSGKHLDRGGTKGLWYVGVAPVGGSHLVGPAEKSIKRLNGILTEDATVLLGGCSVGKGSEGDGLLTTMSSILDGRDVQAFENDVFWWTGVLAGSLKTASGSDVSSEYAAISLL